MTDEIVIDLVESKPIEIDFVSNEIAIDFVQQSLDIEIVAPGEMTVDLIEPSPIVIEFYPGGGGGGLVDSVNGETGVVVLDATDVGADPSGSSAQALIEANNYTDTQIGSLGFLESIIPGAGVTVDDTDPQNPIVSATALPDVIYFLQDQETTSTYAYVGYESADNDWYIYRRTRATNARQYATGASSYSTNWTSRSSLTYI